MLEVRKSDLELVPGAPRITGEYFYLLDGESLVAILTYHEDNKSLLLDEFKEYGDAGLNSLDVLMRAAMNAAARQGILRAVCYTERLRDMLIALGFTPGEGNCAVVENIDAFFTKKCGGE